MKFAWNTSFRKRFVDKFNEWWRVLSMVSGGIGEMHQRVYQFIASQFMKELQGYETLGFDFCRGYLEKLISVASSYRYVALPPTRLSSSPIRS